MALLNLKNEAKKTDNEEIAALKQEIERLKAVDRVRKKYGRVSDQDLERLVKEETAAAQKAETRRINEEKSRKDREERDKKIREAAQEYVRQGKIRVSVNKERVSSVDNSLAPPCPYCGGGLTNADMAILAYATAWFSTEEDQRFSLKSPLLVFSAHNPLSQFVGAPLWVGAGTCKSCGKSASIIVQLVVL